MQRIIRQEIPAVMVNSGHYQWDPFTNKVYDQGNEIASAREADIRYKTFLDTFQAMRLVDAYSPLYPDHISRSFDIGREIPEKEVEAMFRELLASPQVKKVAALIRRRLGRRLQPFDIWYPGLRSGTDGRRGGAGQDRANEIPDRRRLRKGPAQYPGKARLHPGERRFHRRQDPGRPGPRLGP